MSLGLLASIIRYLKEEDPKGVSEMCKAMEDMRNESIRIAGLKIFLVELSLEVTTMESG